MPLLYIIYNVTTKTAMETISCWYPFREYSACKWTHYQTGKQRHRHMQFHWQVASISETRGAQLLFTYRFPPTSSQSQRWIPRRFDTPDVPLLLITCWQQAGWTRYQVLEFATSSLPEAGTRLCRSHNRQRLRISNLMPRRRIYMGCTLYNPI